MASKYQGAATLIFNGFPKATYLFSLSITCPQPLHCRNLQGSFNQKYIWNSGANNMSVFHVSKTV